MRLILHQHVNVRVNEFKYHIPNSDRKPDGIFLTTVAEISKL